MTTTELIKILQDHEKGGISHKSREISLFINGRLMINPQIEVSGTGDGVCGPEIDLDICGEWFESECDEESKVMTYREAVETIKVAKAEVEWEHPMDYYVAFDLAIEALEEKVKDTVEVGDEVYYHDEIGVVVCVANNYHAISVMSGAGGWMIRTDIKELRKTGNHYPQIKEVLEKMKENDND